MKLLPTTWLLLKLGRGWTFNFGPFSARTQSCRLLPKVSLAVSEEGGSPRHTQCSSKDLWWRSSFACAKESTEEAAAKEGCRGASAVVLSRMEVVQCGSAISWLGPY